MNKLRSTTLLALAALATLAGTPARADNMASIAITPATGAVTLTPRWAIGGNLAGFHHMSQDLSLGGGANQFYSIKGGAIPAGGDIAAFTRYIAGSGAATNHADIGSKLTPNSYLALTSADPDIGYGAVNFYFIHRKTTGDYFTAIVPSSGTASAVTDLKPMSGPGGPATLGDSGYFGLTFAAANLGYGLNYFYYFRTDPVTGNTRFGTLNPALLGTAADKFDLGTGGHNALAFTGNDVGFGTDKMYYLRLDPITGFTILGTLHPVTGRASDIANLGSVFSTLTFVSGDVGFGSGQFYTTGAINTTWQSVSFAAIADRAISTGSFTVTPSASSGLAVTLAVVSGSTGAASISGPVGGVFTVTPTAPGVITLQATQAGALAPTPYEYNMLRQSFTATGTATLAITAQPTSQSAVIGTTATFSVAASGTTAVTYQWRKGGANITGNTSATTATLALPNVQTSSAGTYDVVVTNASGSLPSNAITLTATTAAPVVTNSPLTAAATVGTAFSFTITASGSPTGYSATPLPSGLVLNGTTGVISGTPLAAGTTNVLLGATNGTGTGNATLAITVVAAGVAPVIANNPLNAAGTVGSPFSFAITASGNPTAYTAAALPAGLTIASATGVISGTPTAVGTTAVLLGATNGTGTGNATLTITVAAAGVAPIVTNTTLSAGGTVGSTFGYTVTASGTPTVYTATPLPTGLSIVSATGAITGTPQSQGTTTVLLGATNAFGTGNATLTITVSPAAVAPTITNSPLAVAGTVGTPFSFAIAATDSASSYTAGTLPAGLVFNTQTGTISGTPTAAGTRTVLLGASNGAGTGNATLTITVAPAGIAPIVTNTPLTVAGTVGTPFGFTIAASNLPIGYAANPLPAGLVINPTTGVITGTPTAVGTTNVLLGASNATGTGNATLTITVVAASVAPVITNTVLSAPGNVGSPFGFFTTASGLPTSYTSSPLPAGLTLSATTGAISGVPTATGTTTVLITARNSAGSDSATLTITVAAAGIDPIITNDPLAAAGTVGIPFGFTIAASGQPTGYAAANLPAGLVLNPVTGTISGIPLGARTSVVTLNANNAFGTGSATLTITVGAANGIPIIANTPLAAAGTVGTPFGFTIIATGLPTRYAADGLPPGLSVNGMTGIISGTPTSPGVSVVTLNATNAIGTGNATITLTIAAGGGAPIIANTPLAAAGTVGTPFSFATVATGLPTRYAANGLPIGLAINNVTGVISGTPSFPGVATITLNATNATGTGAATLTLTVAASGTPVIANTPLAAAGTVGRPFSFPIVATGLPTGYAADNLPAGLVVNGVTGLISGTPTTAGVSIVTLNATNAFGTGNGILTITVSAGGSAPIIANSPLAAAGTVGTPFGFAIVATGSPTGYAANGLPSGLTLNALTGVISGTPTFAGVSNVTLNANNATGTGSATLTLTVGAAGTVPAIANAPLAASGIVGRPFGFVIVATGLPTIYAANGLPAGLVLNSVTGVISGTPSAAGTSTVTLNATNASGTGNAVLTITIVPVPVAPFITGPTAAAGTAGTPFATFLIAATGSPTSYSATGLPAGLVLNAQTGAITGTPVAAGTSLVTLTATNAVGSSTVVLTLVIAPAPSSRIVNFSARAISGPGNATLIMGFVVQGNGKNLLVRGIGPALAAFGVTSFVADPMLSLYNGAGAEIASNDDWQSTAGPLLASTAARVGAFALAAGSKDSALLLTLGDGAHTTSMLRTASPAGVALTEIYDTDTTGTARLVNVSARMNVSAGEGTLVAGLSISGNAPKTVLIRGIGPTLAAFGVTATLTDPKITVFAAGNEIATNDNWETGTTPAATLAATSAQVGAFALAAGSRDASLLITLQPGSYTVHVTGVGTAAGVALVEVYDVR